MSLHSFGGQPAPASCAADLRMVASLPASAKDGLWPLLEHHLGPTISDGVQPLVDAFCAEHSVTEDELVPVVRGCRELFVAAAGRDVGPETMARDLNELFSDDRGLVNTLLGLYAKALPRVRALNIAALMGEYGAVADDVSMRLDLVPMTRHEPASMVPIAMMSLRYREQDEARRLAVQLPMPVLVKLHAICEALIGQQGGST